MTFIDWTLICICICRAIKQDVDEPTVKKQKVDEVDSALEKKIEKQNKEYYKLRDQLQSDTKKSVHISILEANQQAIPEGNSEVHEFILHMNSLQN